MTSTYPHTTRAAAAPDTSAALFGHASHVVCLLTGFPYLAWIPALCLKAAAKNDHDRAHATTALNFALTQLIVWTVWAAAFVTALLAVSSTAAAVALVVLGLAGLAYFALGVRHTFRALFHAYRIEPFRYPAYLAFRMVR
ncbi:DUF4870 domain-containing protein [Streptomyces sp. TRM66268-LWL]|uniref:DUF4870 domain-containing protein n=1 Tax=Streptomyces polyasparticus TaxID=2767826 RepID=A0ABR7SU66_9ACTN|nr:DUF4870 domain-containing protein [Streptomyces polyasparticus]MBC9718195.1 DUF4870 domain-containing protein [Streptomyces polyasparticus]